MLAKWLSDIFLNLQTQPRGSYFPLRFKVWQQQWKKYSLPKRTLMSHPMIGWLLPEENPSGAKESGLAAGVEGGVLPARDTVWTSGVLDSDVPTWLQLVSGLLHHKAVQALKVPPPMMLVTLLPRPEDDQGGVTSNLKKRGNSSSSLTRVPRHPLKPCSYYAACRVKIFTSKLKEMVPEWSWSQMYSCTKLQEVGVPTSTKLWDVLLGV